jgi:hypothetical protein
MAHCPPELLRDLAGLFGVVRTWPGIVEKKPGVFYVHQRPFLHFHLVAGRRQADVKGRTDWVQVDLPRPATAARRRALLRELRQRYADAAPAAEAGQRVRRVLMRATASSVWAREPKAVRRK